MNYKLKDYLPDSESRIARLRKIVDERPVAIFAAGPSIHELEARIGELRRADICYFGLNNFFVQEVHILRTINKRMSVVMCGSPAGVAEAMDGITNFLDRDEENMFISSSNDETFGLLDKSFSREQFLADYDKKLLFIGARTEKTIPNKEYPLHFMTSNSLLVLIQMALIGKASSIVLFGADGHCGENAQKYYYRQNEYEARKWPKTDLLLINDTMCQFNPIASVAIRNTYKTYGLRPVNILNCSKKSFYTPFPKISYDEAVEYLATGKKMIGKLDLRIPAKPKVPNLWILTVQKINNFFKKHKWNVFSAGIRKIWRDIVTMS